MNLASALIKKVLEESDFDTWMNVRKHYLPTEYHRIFEVIDKHTIKFHKLPTIEELKLEIRDASTLDKVYALEGIEVEAEPFLLLDYLKNEYAQKEALFQLDRWVDKSIAFESAEEVVRNIYDIATELENKVDITPPEQSMQKINLFDSEEEMSRRIKLGLNREFDQAYDFRTTDYIMIGGKRGSGKSLTASNISNNVVENLGKKALYFSIEMQSREVLQRDCAISTEIPFYKIRNKTLDNLEWEKVAAWWSRRYINSEEFYKAYLHHRDFNKLHAELSRLQLRNNIVDIVYDPHLTLGRIRAESEKRAAAGDLGLIVVDYINQVKKSTAPNYNGQFDWKEQIEISKSLKLLAQDLDTPVFTPYQIDKTGEARFAKGILDAADASFILDAHKHEDNAMTFQVTKMRGARDDLQFTTKVDWGCLRIGPDSVEKPEAEDEKAKVTVGGRTMSKDIYDD